MLNHRQHRVIQFGGSEAPPASRLICADNLAIASTCADRSLDLIYIDPPFGTGRAHRSRQGRYLDHLQDPDRFVEWLEPRLVHSRRTLADHGSLFVHLDHRTVHYVKVALDRLFGRNRFVNEIIWCYSVGGKSGQRFGRKHDTILWYSRGADYAFFPDAVRVPRKPGSHMRVERDETGEAVQIKTDRKTGKVYRYPVSAGKVPEDWWTDVETLNRGDKQRVGWPTQKPERLLERIINGASGPGATIADWFCGSATTAVVAQRSGRHFVAVDVESSAIECADRRLRQVGRAMVDAGNVPGPYSLELHHSGATPSSSDSASSPGGPAASVPG